MQGKFFQTILFIALAAVLLDSTRAEQWVEQPVRSGLIAIGLWGLAPLASALPLAIAIASLVMIPLIWLKPH